QPQHDGKQPQHDGKQPQHDGKQPPHNGKLPPKGSEHSGKPLAAERERAQRETAAAESVTLWPGLPRQAFFHPSSAIVDKLLPFFEMPEKKPALRLT
ncbi:hypothetical protein V7H43_13305, partial [Klebsiella pneumoniae]